MALKHNPTPETQDQVRTMCAVGIPLDSIARCIGINGISVPTLRKYYREELATSMDKANTKVLGSLYNNAVTHNNATAQIFWAKTRCGWKEPAQDVNVAGELVITIKDPTKRD